MQFWNSDLKLNIVQPSSNRIYVLYIHILLALNINKQHDNMQANIPVP